MAAMLGSQVTLNFDEKTFKIEIHYDEDCTDYILLISYTGFLSLGDIKATVLHVTKNPFQDHSIFQVPRAVLPECPTATFMQVTVYRLKKLGSSLKQKSYRVLTSGRSKLQIGSEDKVEVDLMLHVNQSLTTALPSFTVSQFDIDLKFNPSSFPSEYRISFEPSEDICLIQDKMALLVLRQVSTGEEHIIMDETSGSVIDISVPLGPKPTTKYDTILYILGPECDTGVVMGRKVSKFSQIMKFGTYMTKENLEALKRKAVEWYCGHGNRMAVLTQLWRNKPKHYFDDIGEKGGVMEKYSKDYNGDLSSWINGNIEGLFFSSALDRMTGQMPTFSWFGERRFHVPVKFLFNNEHNLYFADFYCHYGSVHYVTLVLTKKGSSTDKQCEERLLWLNKYDNPFLVEEHSLSCMMNRTMTISNTVGSEAGVQETCSCDAVVKTTISLHVEILYTEDIDISGLKNKEPDKFYFSDTRVMGLGHSRKRGIPKSASCSICNL